MPDEQEPPIIADVVSIGSRMEAISGVRIGWLIGSTPEGIPLVDFEGNKAGPLPALSIEEIQHKEYEQAGATRQEVVLAFESGDPLKPVILGRVAKPQRMSPTKGEASLLEPIVEGERIVIEGQEEIVLQCGKASITLSRDGMVVIRGIEVESRAKKANRIKGGSVRIN